MPSRKQVNIKYYLLLLICGVIPYTLFDSNLKKENTTSTKQEYSKICKKKHQFSNLGFRQFIYKSDKVTHHQCYGGNIVVKSFKQDIKLPRTFILPI